VLFAGEEGFKKKDAPELQLEAGFKMGDKINDHEEVQYNPSLFIIPPLHGHARMFAIGVFQIPTRDHWIQPHSSH
jgi:hypothetical protein